MSKPLALSLIVLAPLALAACGGGGNTAAAVNETLDATGNAAGAMVGAVENAVTPAAAATNYDCLPALKLRASYDNSGATPTARVTIGDRSYDLANVPAGSGARYVTDQGRSPGKTLVWWTKGNDGTLYEGKVGGAQADEKQIASCSAR